MTTFADEVSLERHILSAVLQDGKVIVDLQAAGMDRRDFTDPRLNVIWRAAVAVAARGQIPDPVTVVAFLREHEGAVERAGNVEFIADLLGEVCPPGPVQPYAMSWLRSLRQLRAAKANPLAMKQQPQFDAARQRMKFGEDKFIRYPLPTLDRMRGGWAAGEVDFLASGSGGGKTTLLGTLSRKWVAQGKRVYYAGFELPPESLRLQWAAHDAGFYPADIISGEYLTWDNADDVRARVLEALAVQESRLDYLRCADVSYVTADSIKQMAREAADWGCDVFIIDHIDHVDGQSNLHQQSRQVTSAVLTSAKDTGVRFLVATQLNQSGLDKDRLRSHRPVREEWVKQGGHKKEISTFMFGLSRAIRSGVTKEELKAVRDFGADIATIEEPMAGQLNVMKHRHYGSRVGKTALVSWERGEYVEYMSEQDRKTQGRVLVRRDLLAKTGT